MLSFPILSFLYYITGGTKVTRDHQLGLGHLLLVVEETAAEAEAQATGLLFFFFHI